MDVIKTTPEVTDVIVVKQLPVIEEQLRIIKEEVEWIVSDAMSMECTEETVKSVKKKRSELNAMYKDYEERRKSVKSQILAPYQAFDSVYTDCISDPFEKADRELKQKIATVEDGVKNEKEKQIQAYFAEYRESIGVPERFARYENAGIKVTLSASEKSLKDSCRAYLDRVSDDLSVIRAGQNPDEVLYEYETTGNVARAVSIVKERHEAIERSRERDAVKESSEADEMAEEIENIMESEEAFNAPVVEDDSSSLAVPEAERNVSDVCVAKFMVITDIENLKKLKNFMVGNDIYFESIKN